SPPTWGPSCGCWPRASGRTRRWAGARRPAPTRASPGSPSGTPPAGGGPRRRSWTGPGRSSRTSRRASKPCAGERHAPWRPRIRGPCRGGGTEGAVSSRERRGGRGGRRLTVLPAVGVVVAGAVGLGLLGPGRHQGLLLPVPDALGQVEGGGDDEQHAHPDEGAHPRIDRQQGDAAAQTGAGDAEGDDRLEVEGGGDLGAQGCGAHGSMVGDAASARMSTAT